MINAKTSKARERQVGARQGRRERRKMFALAEKAKQEYQAKVDKTPFAK